jgi:hypothetical protein
MGRRIEWQTPGSDKVHGIPEGAAICFVNDGMGSIRLWFNDDGNVDYRKTDIVGNDQEALSSRTLVFAKMFDTREGVDRQKALVLDSVSLIKDFVEPVLDLLDKEAQNVVLSEIIGGSRRSTRMSKIDKESDAPWVLNSIPKFLLFFLAIEVGTILVLSILK